MAKDINIHVNARGTRKAKAGLDQTARGAEKLGKSVEHSGGQAARGGSRIMSMLGKLAGPLGFTAVLAAVGMVAGKIGSFFQALHDGIDRAVTKLAALQSGFEGLFEAMGKFDRVGRAEVMKDALELLKTSAVSKDIGLPVIEEYTRQFAAHVESGQLSRQDYGKGLEGMLGYAARHGGTATPELIQIMAGWDIVQPAEQGAFRRMIATAAGKTGLRDSEVISALGRGMPTFRAMGWTPDQAVEAVAVIASAATGRQKRTLPAAAIAALGAPQEAAVKEMGLPEELAESPRALFNYVQQAAGTMPHEQYYSMLTKLYGTGGASGIYALVAGNRTEIQKTLRQAAGPGGIETEALEESQRKGTLPALEAVTRAEKNLMLLRRKSPHWYQKEIRDIGQAYQKEVLEVEEPIRQYFREMIQLKPFEPEYAAKRKWFESLSDKERKQMSRYPGLVTQIWDMMTPQEQYESLTGNQKIPVRLRRLRVAPKSDVLDLPSDIQTEPNAAIPPVEGNLAPATAGPQHITHIYRQINYNPKVGSDERGPMVDRNIR